jgi:hypothetical protein
MRPILLPIVAARLQRVTLHCHSSRRPRRPTPPVQDRLDGQICGSFQGGKTRSWATRGVHNWYFYIAGIDPSNGEAARVLFYVISLRHALIHLRSTTVSEGIGCCEGIPVLVCGCYHEVCVSRNLNYGLSRSGHKPLRRLADEQSGAPPPASGLGHFLFPAGTALFRLTAH